jgi:hypothetical protein
MSVGRAGRVVLQPGSQDQSSAATDSHDSLKIKEY